MDHKKTQFDHFPSYNSIYVSISFIFSTHPGGSDVPPPRGYTTGNYLLKNNIMYMLCTVQTSVSYKLSRYLEPRAASLKRLVTVAGFFVRVWDWKCNLKCCPYFSEIDQSASFISADNMLVRISLLRMQGMFKCVR